MLLDRIKKVVDSGSARTVRAKKNILAMLGLKGLSILCSLILVPLTIDYISSYEYGIWLTISSLVAWLSFFDFGIGNGLRNKFIAAVEQGKHKLARILVSTSYALISILVVVAWLVGVIAAFFINWCELLNVNPNMSNVLSWTVAIVVTNFSLQFVLGLVRTLVTAVQKPALASSFDTLAQVLQCIVILIIVNTTEGSLIVLALSLLATISTVLIIANFWCFRGLLKQYKPSFRYIRFRLARGIMSLGIMFFFLQIISIAFYQTNNLIISHYVGPEEVTIYNIAYKYTLILNMVFGILIAPFWSAYAEARVNEDYEWIRRTTDKLIRYVFVLVIAGIIMVIVSPWVYKLWIGNKVGIPILITTMVCIFQLLNIWSTLWTQLLCGFGKIRLQTIMSLLCVLTYLPLGIWACSRFGLIGLLTASILSLILFTSWFGIIQVRKLTRRTATGIWNK